MSKINTDASDMLYQAISGMNTPEECRAFFEDLCTIKELQDMAQRFNTALMLDKGYSYQKIAAAENISTATISRVNRCLQYGSNGYRTAIDRIRNGEDK